MRRTTVLLTLVVAAAVVVLATVAPVHVQSQARLLIRNAELVDGTGAPARRADVRIVGDRIADVGALTPTGSEEVVDAGGMTLVPGFIDTHSHHDRGLADRRDALAAVSQGITTIVVGQDGGSPMPLADFFSRVDAAPATVNVASYVGHGTVRRAVLGDDFRRPATADEIAKMQALVEQEMRVGALGLSTGLEYDPGIYSAPEEVVALARAVAPFGGRYISHVRSEDRELWKAIDEVIAIGRETGIPVQVGHIKLAMKSLWGQSERLIEMLDRARASGVNITADVYPYTYWQSGMTVLFPERDFTDRAAAEFALRELVTPENLLVVGFGPDPSLNGRTLAQIAALRGTDPATTMMALIHESDGSGPGIVATSMDEKDVAELIAWPLSNICSDGALDGAHPRGFGAFTRVLGRFVRDERVVALEEAIRKMTTLAAANVGLTDRGAIAPGQFADLVLFDPSTVADRATTDDPHVTSVGIESVWVNGVLVYDGATATDARPGRVLRRASR
ncbi:MAG TPA: D-aminoacylase [Vicinamibacterales bacterium]|nr:D-aminoacylase [Vicinamibacterales bacterium]